MSNKLQLSDKNRFDFLCQRLEEDEHIFAHCQSRNEKLDIPEYLKKDDTVTLKLSYHFRGRVKVFQDHIDASLSFKGIFYECYIPLSSVLACTTTKNETFIFPDENETESTKEELKEVKKTKEKAKETEGNKPKKAKPFLKRVK